MTDNHNLRESLKQILLAHQGRMRAIKGKEIARRLGFKDDRQIRQVIRELIAEGYPIASAVQHPQGYFLVDNLIEAKDYQQSLKDRLIEDARRLRDFKRSAGRKLDMVVQGKLI